jgi:flagellar protein FlaI
VSDVDDPPAEGPTDAEALDGDPSEEDAPLPVAVGEYTWAEFMRDHGFGDDVDRAYRDVEDDDADGLFGFTQGESRASPAGEDWAAVEMDPGEWLGFPPGRTRDRVASAGGAAKGVHRAFGRWIDETPVVKDAYTWEHFRWEYHYEDGERPREDGEVIAFDPSAYLGFDPATMGDRLEAGADAAADLRGVVDRRTVNVDPGLDEDAFFLTASGHTTLTNRYDLEKAVDAERKGSYLEVERYWVDKPYAFVVIFHSLQENEKKYYLVSPHRTEIERSLIQFLAGKLQTAIKYADDDAVVGGTEEERRAVLEREARRLMERYDLYADGASSLRYLLARARELLGFGGGTPSVSEAPADEHLEGIAARPEPAVVAEDAGTLTEYQVHKLLYLLKRNFLGYERIDGIKHDINVEDISCDGYDSPVFVYHTDYEQLITNVHHGTDQLDDFVVKLAQRSGKGISQRRPQVDATLPDGSRAQLTLGTAVSDHGTNYTIRQFNEIPFTPVDLINWNTFSLEQMAFLWLCIENKRSLIFAGGTASGKTTSLNAVSLFIPSNAKIVSIEDTREVELPQRNWVASVTRPAFGTGDRGDVDEFDLLEAALRQRPDYIVMGEVRGEEGRTLFQVMSTGHTTLTTFHADDVSEVLKRFTTDPINVSKTLFTSLDLVSVQTQTRVRGEKVRRNKTLTEINHYDPENDEINVQDVYQWEPEDDEFLPMATSNTLQKVAFDRGWSEEALQRRLFERRVVLAYLVANGFREYTEVAATIQGFINDPETLLTILANDRLADHLEDLRRMDSVTIGVDPEKEALVPRPEPDDATHELARRILDRAEDDLFPEYRGTESRSLSAVLSEIADAPDVTADPDDDGRLEDMFQDTMLLGADGEAGADEAGADEADGGEAAAGPEPIESDGGVDEQGGDQRDEQATD